LSTPKFLGSWSKLYTHIL